MVAPLKFAHFRFVSIEQKSAKKSPFATRNSNCNFKEQKPRFRWLYEGCVTSGHLAREILHPSIPPDILPFKSIDVRATISNSTAMTGLMLTN